ncbi:MAG: magnesium-dependent phosphatase-1 [Rubripirellula sp.]
MDTERSQPSVFQPVLVVFDLDFTLWDCDGTWCDCLSPPFHRKHGNVSDGRGRVVKLYDHVHPILDHCDQLSVPMALASRTEQPTWAKQLVELLGIRDRFAYSEIYPTSKQRHFSALRRASGIAFDQMLFFDDEMRNIEDVGSLGVTCIHVANGINHERFQSGLSQMSIEGQGGE